MATNAHKKAISSGSSARKKGQKWQTLTGKGQHDMSNNLNETAEWCNLSGIHLISYVPLRGLPARDRFQHPPYSSKLSFIWTWHCITRPSRQTCHSSRGHKADLNRGRYSQFASAVPCMYRVFHSSFYSWKDEGPKIFNRCHLRFPFFTEHKVDRWRPTGRFARIAPRHGPMWSLLTCPASWVPPRKICVPCRSKLRFAMSAKHH
jgi:hypothetical protein